jgi:hypothetical protein
MSADRLALSLPLVGRGWGWGCSATIDDHARLQGATTSPAEETSRRFRTGERTHVRLEEGSMQWSP